MHYTPYVHLCHHFHYCSNFLVTQIFTFYRQLLPCHSESLHNFTAKYLDMGFGLLLAIRAKKLGRRDGHVVAKDKDKLEAAGMSHSASNNDIFQVWCPLLHLHILNIMVFFFFFSFLTNVNLESELVFYVI